MTEKTFYKVTNKNIYEKLISIEKHVIKTNGRVTLNRWISSTALGLSMLVIGVVMSFKFFGG